MDPPAATTSERSFNYHYESSPLDLNLEQPEPEPESERSHLRKAKTVMAREMRKKRITFGQNHGDPRADYSRSLALAETSPAPAAAAGAEAGILRRGRFSAKKSHAHAYASSSNDAPLAFLATLRQRRSRSPIVITAIGVLSFGMAACFLLAGQMLPDLTAPVPVLLRKLRGAPAPRRRGFDQMATILRAETAGMPPGERKRRLAVVKSVWPRCVTKRMSAIQCKQLIDEEVLQYNTNTDRFIRTIIVGKRAENDPLSNSVVILLDDDNMVKGKNGDGMIYYDFKWDGSGNEATRYQQRKIPEIVANETTWTIEWNIVPIRQLGATTYDAIHGHSGAHICGGVMTLGTETNTVQGTIKLTQALSETATIELSGKRSIGPFDCSGMTGHSCCLMIKHKVRDSDKKGRAIQCYTDYLEDTEKHKAMMNSRGKKIFIFENHNGRISKEPKVVGDWPEGIADSNPDFNDWIQDGGGLSDGQMRLIHGPNWQPPGQI